MSALLRAAELSPARADRSRRLAQAALVGASVTMEVATVSGLLSDARQAGPEPGMSLLTAATAAFMLLNGDGDVITAHRLLTQAIEDQAEPDRSSGAGLFEAISTLFIVCVFGGQADLWAPFHAAISRFAQDLPADLYLLSQTHANPVRTAAAVLPQVDAAIASLRGETDHSGEASSRKPRGAQQSSPPGLAARIRAPTSTPPRARRAGYCGPVAKSPSASKPSSSGSSSSLSPGESSDSRGSGAAGSTCSM